MKPGQSDPAMREEVLERFMLGFEGTSLPGWLADLLSAGLAGVAIYPRNYESPQDLHDLTSAIRSAAARPVLIGIDQEGGTRFSLEPPFTQWPSPPELGQLDAAARKSAPHEQDAPPKIKDLAEDVVERLASAISRELCAVGINLDFAPMLDLATNPASKVTAGRSFGADPDQVARLGIAFLRGLSGEGVLGCAKHFPGHGDTDIDPHFDLPRFEGTRERLASHELVPFAAAIDAGVPLVMTAHILLPHVDPNRPASISQRVLDSLLRRELHFDGVILADDLGMGALTRRYGHAESAVKTLEGGTDIAMLCHSDANLHGSPPCKRPQAVSEALEAVAESVEGGRFDPAQWAAGRTRIAHLREQIRLVERAAPPLGAIGCAEHVRLAAEIRARIEQ